MSPGHPAELTGVLSTALPDLGSLLPRSGLRAELVARKSCLSIHNSPQPLLGRPVGGRRGVSAGRKYGEEKEGNMTRKKENKVQFRKKALKQQKWGNSQAVRPGAGGGCVESGWGRLCGFLQETAGNS